MNVYGSDRVLLYNVEPWRELGFGVANFGDNIGTVSFPLWRLADEIGKVQLYVMTHIDAQRTAPPSINTVKRVAKLLNRIQTVLAGRLKQDADQRLEEGHATATVLPWSIHPAPYFNSMVLRNAWLKEYNSLTMIALTNFYQHSDNNLALTVTKAFAQDVWQYFQEIKMYLGMELLLLPKDTVQPETFIFTDEHFAGYEPSLVTFNFESLDTPGPIESRVTEDALRPLFEGIPATMIIDALAQYPVSGDLGYSGGALAAGATAPGSGGAAVGPAGGTIGQPTI